MLGAIIGDINGFIIKKLKNNSEEYTKGLYSSFE